ncbi:cytochrome P450 [Artemisia annua]|uniref:Cytochrome P450 n=1 Tax=Artemisia annua TaxID=35608 RepID=A0A2U1PIK0_ARTAN|nr:cytochrome P450 [Artemisia annua]
MTPSMSWHFHCIHDYTANLLKQNGGTFMYKGPWFAKADILFTSDPDNYNYISSTNFHNYPKGPEFREIFDILGDGIFNCDSELWELHRKTTISLFKDDEFSKLVEKTMWNNMEKKLMPLLEYMSEQGSRFDLENTFQRLTFDGIMNLLLDHDPKTLAVELPHHKLEGAIAKGEETLFDRHLLPKYCWKFLKLLNTGKEKHLSKSFKLSDEVFYKFIYEKQEKGTKANDVKKEQVEDQSLLTGFMREYKDQTGSSGNFEKFIKDTLFNLLIAGRDTTSSALTFFFYLLAKNPVAESKIREEIHVQSGIKEGEKWKPFGTKELEKLAYLHGALCEALRLYPPVPINHKVPVEADTLPSGHRVNPGTKVFLHSYAMGRMETIWGQDCLEFKPERWLSKQGGLKHIPSYKFTAFHAGPRTCLGKKMSLIQMKFVAAAIVYNYKVELMMGGLPITPQASVILQTKHGLMVKVTKRNDVKLR